MDDNFLEFLANLLPPIWSRKPLTIEEKINENIKNFEMFRGFNHYSLPIWIFSLLIVMFAFPSVYKM